MNPMVPKLERRIRELEEKLRWVDYTLRTVRRWEWPEDRVYLESLGGHLEGLLWKLRVWLEFERMSPEPLRGIECV